MMRLRSFCAALHLAALLLPAPVAVAQTPKTYSSSEILLGLKKLNVLGSVLYIAAHPDDENTRLIAYLANGRLLETGYLSCTRGDGGQNLIGPELGEGLGVIRTQELLAARRIDGGRQFFTRANDFGFSKTPDETFTIWDREQVLSDMVWVIRQRRPDVLITRFPPDGRGGHGHHTASCLLAIDAFSAAGDPKRFPEQLQHVQAWQPKRLVWNTGSFFIKQGDDLSQYLKLDAGAYNPLLGQSYGEIAARSRSQHKSQGFGSAAQRGESLEYFQLLKGDPAKTDLFEGVDVSWNRVPGGAAVGKLVDEVIRKYDPSNPAASVAELLKVRSRLRDNGGFNVRAEDARFWRLEKLSEVDELIRVCLGLYMEATASQPTTIAGEFLDVDIKLVNRSATALRLGAAHVFDVIQDPIPVLRSSYKRESKDPNDPKHEFSLPTELLPNTSINESVKIYLPKSDPIGQPYWLREKGSVGMYTIPDTVTPSRLKVSYESDGSVASKDVLGKPENPPVVELMIPVQQLGLNAMYYRLPVQYKSTDPVDGEKYRPLTVVPPVAVNIAGRAYVFADTQPKTVPVTLRAGKAGVKGTLALALPAGWKAEPASIPFELKAKDAEQTVQFRVQPGAGAQDGKTELRAVATVEGQAYSRGYQVIEYNHIPTQTLFPEAVSPLVKLDLKRKGQEIGYLMGAGDEVPDALRQIGYTVTLLKPDDLTDQNLRRFDAVVLGVRAYNTVDRLKTLQPTLLKYVENGGNLVVQYVVSRETVLPEIGPYPLTLSRDRVTVENAPVKLLNPQQPLLNTPNKITTKDFEGWVQEQGLYYPSAWDPKYQTVISSSDPGETPKESAILVAKHGKGHYIYTGLSFFRELPAGVPGAYRLLTNMVSLGK